MKQKEIKLDQPGVTKRRFLYNLSRASYRKNWGSNYERPSISDEFLAFLLRLIPKFGPLRVLQLKMPTPQTQQMFEASFNTTLDLYRRLLRGAADDGVVLVNDNFDTGDTTGPGQYNLDDETQAKLLDKLAKQNFSGVSPELRAELLAYFSQPDEPNAVRRHHKQWAKVQAQVAQLRSASAD